jgi:hypothetical protein
MCLFTTGFALHTALRRAAIRILLLHSFASYVFCNWLSRKCQTLNSGQIFIRIELLGMQPSQRRCQRTKSTTTPCHTDWKMDSLVRQDVNHLPVDIS